MKKYKIITTLMTAGLAAQPIVQTVVPITIYAAEQDGSAKEVWKANDEYTEMTRTEKIRELIHDIDPSSDESIKENRYKEVKRISEDEMEPGDLIVMTNRSGKRKVYAYISEGKAYNLTATNKYEEVDYSFTGSGAKFYSYEKIKSDEDPDIPSGLMMEYGDKLSTVALPKNYRWATPTETAKNVGNTFFGALYLSANDYKYEAKEISIPINVKKKRISLIIPNSNYKITYKPGMKVSDSIELPEHWKFKTEPEVKTGTYTVVYDSADEAHYDYQGQALERNIYIELLKINPSYAAPGKITVTKGQYLSNSLLPGAVNGIFYWEKSQIVTSTGTYYCEFVPHDKEHYNVIKNIPVTVAVKAGSSITDKPVIPITPEPEKPSGPTTDSGGNGTQNNQGNSKPSTEPKKNPVVEIKNNTTSSVVPSNTTTSTPAGGETVVAVQGNSNYGKENWDRWNSKKTYGASADITSASPAVEVLTKTDENKVASAKHKSEKQSELKKRPAVDVLNEDDDQVNDNTKSKEHKKKNKNKQKVTTQLINEKAEEKSKRNNISMILTVFLGTCVVATILLKIKRKLTKPKE